MGNICGIVAGNRLGDYRAFVVRHYNRHTRGAAVLQICGTGAGTDVSFGGGAGSLLLNILWLIFGGLELALASAVCGLVLCVTIVGIPFGLQCFKLAQLALMPFGSEVY